MSHRFFITPPTGGAASLDGAEAHHLLHVMRAKVGDEVTLFDGSGGEWPATLSAVGRSRVDFALGERREVDRELPLPLVLGVAMPKGDRQKVLIEKLTELGVTRLVPLTTKRSVAQPKSSALDKLRRTVVEASKQCGRNRLMAIDEPDTFEAFLNAAPTDATRLIAHPTSETFSVSTGDGERWVAIGPEGGFTEDEVATAIASSWRAASLGSRILRIETAALAFASVLGSNGSGSPSA